MTRATYYFDKKTQKMVEGYPPDENIYYSQAPMFIADSMPKQYHEGACREIESRSEWKRADQECGTITFGSIQEAKPKVDQFYKQKKYKDEMRRASKAALEAYRSNPREVKERLKKQAEIQMETLKKSGLDKQLKEQGVKYDDK